MNNALRGSFMKKKNLGKATLVHNSGKEGSKAGSVIDLKLKMIIIVFMNTMTILMIMKVQASYKGNVGH